jgi:hypothetical protein
MDERFFHIVEVVFTAYAIPALIVPLLWLARWAGRSWFESRTGSRRALSRIVDQHSALLLAWLLLWGAMRLGVPIEKGGSLAAAVCWTGYALANILLARLLLRFTAEYGSLPPGAATDRLFVRLLGAIIAQPVMTTLAFSVLYRVSGVAWQWHMPGLPTVQEGI